MGLGPDVRQFLRAASIDVPVSVLPDPGRSAPAFLDALTRSAIYWSLPVPASHQRRFRSFDLTVMVCSHSRVADLGRLLSRLAGQDYAGSFEVIVWNNNHEYLGDVEDICSPWRDRLALKLIHSSENYFCLPRLAVTSLMRSELLLICDDDVLPAGGFITRFVSRFERYGPEAAVCARGHVFLPHVLDEEQPERAWTEHRGLQFFDQREEDRRVHFMHAGSCLLPRHVLRAAGRYDMEHEEFALVDDYWLSFVLGHHLGAPVWKIRADDVFSLTPSSEDPAVALFHHPAVRHERVRFYIHHMRAGWPDFEQPGTEFRGSSSAWPRRRRRRAAYPPRGV